MYRLWNVVVITTGYWWTVVERSGCSDWLLVDGLVVVVFIATVYCWTSWGT